jgi:hypothetical protein
MNKIYEIGFPIGWKTSVTRDIQRERDKPRE